MLDAALIVLGVLLVAGVFLDAVVTTLSVGAKAGWLTQRVSGVLWRALRAGADRGRLTPVLAPSGVIMLLSTFIVWVALLWAGFTLIFLAGDPSVVESTTGIPGNVVQRVYFVGFTIFTLGVGDFVAASDGWRLLTSFASLCGLALITLAVTYTLSVVSAVVSRRSLAVHIHSLGETPEQIVINGWTGSSFSSAFTQHLVSLASEISTQAEQHLAYPVLHYFHSGSRTTATPVAIATLNDAVVLLQAAVAEDVRPPTTAIQPVQYAIVRHLRTSSFAGAVNRDVTTPPEPDRTALEQAGVPVVPAEQFRCDVALHTDRRRGTHRLLRSEGWTWSGA